MVDGFTIRNIGSQGNLTNFVPDMGSSQEVAFDYAANSAEAVTGGVLVNYIPKEGGNTFKGSFFGTVATSDFQSDNYTDELAAKGLRAPNRMKFNKDINPSGGGPVLQDRLWFYGTLGGRSSRTTSQGCGRTGTPETRRSGPTTPPSTGRASSVCSSSRGRCD